MLEKAATNKRLEYLSLSSELKKQTDTTKKQYHLLTRFIDLIEGNEIMNKKPTLKKYKKSDLTYNNN